MRRSSRAPANTKKPEKKTPGHARRSRISWRGSSCGSGMHRRRCSCARSFDECATHAVDQEIRLVGADAEVRREAQRVRAAVDDAVAVLAQPFLGTAGAVALELGRKLAREEKTR